MFGHLVASHNARDPQRREAYLLDQLQDVHTWQGSIIHKALHKELEDALPLGKFPTESQLVWAAKDLARRQFTFSAEGLYRAEGATKSNSDGAFCALTIHEPGTLPSSCANQSAMLEQVYSLIEQCFRNLFSQIQLLDLIKKGSKHRVEKPLTMPFNGLTLSASPDLLFTIPQDRVVIIDWKVGDSSTSDYSRQLLTYAMVVSRCGWWPNVQPSSIDLYEVNLLNNYIHQHPVDEQKLLEIEDFVYLSGVQMAGLAGSGKYADLDPSGFEIATNLNNCKYCHFRSMCIQWLEREGRDSDASVVGQMASQAETGEEPSVVQGRLW